MAQIRLSGSGNWIATFTGNVSVECWGGGGGGGGNNITSDGGGGGGGGAYSKQNTFAVIKGNSYAYVVGTGGNGGSGAMAGTDGGDTYWINTATCLAKGGVKGLNSTGTPPAGGLGGAAASGVGDVKYSGGQGEKARDTTTGSGGYGGSSAGTAANGYSGPQTWSTITYPTASTPVGGGHGGNGSATSPGSAPVAGTYGGGGGGAGKGVGGVGGKGANGTVLLTVPDNLPPTVNLSSPANAATVNSLKLTLSFVGADDTYADNIRYRLQIKQNGGLSWTSFAATGAGSQEWNGIAINYTNHDVYVCSYLGNIYKQTGGTGSFVSEAVGAYGFRKLAVDQSDGSVYAAYNSGIFKKVNGAGSWVSQGITADFGSLAVDSGNHNAYASVNGGIVYKQTGGTGSFTALSGVTGVTEIAVDNTNHNVYATVYNGNVYVLTGGTGSFVSLGLSTAYWYGLYINQTNHDVYVCVANGTGAGIYKRTGGTGSFTEIGAGAGNWQYVAVDETNGDIYVSNSTPGVYKQTGGVGSFVNQTSAFGAKYYNEVAIDQSSRSVYVVTGQGSGSDIYKSTASAIVDWGTPDYEAYSNVNAGFTDITNGANSDPFPSGDTISHVVQSNLLNNVLYNWRVAGLDPSGSNTYGAWSDNRTFILSQYPPSVSLNSPANAVSVGSTPSLVFTGNDAEGNEIEYQLQVDLVSTFENGGWADAPHGLSGISIRGISVNYTTGDVFFATYGGDIYKQTGGNGSFVAVGAGNKNWNGIYVNSLTGDVWATVDNYVYKQVGGSGSFIDQAAGAKAWGAIAVDESNGDVHIAINNGAIWKQTGGTGSYVDQGSGSKYWTGIAVNSTTHDVFACTAMPSPGIYKRTSGTGSWNLLTGSNSPLRNWYGLSVNQDTSDLYAGVYYDGYGSGIIKMDGLTGVFTAINTYTLPFTGVVVNKTTGVVKACYNGNTIYTYSVTPPVLDKVSLSDIGFSGIGDPHPWPSGNQVTYTVQSALAAGTTYYWRVRAKDLLGSNIWGAWSAYRSFTISQNVTPPTPAGCGFFNWFFN